MNILLLSSFSKEIRESLEGIDVNIIDLNSYNSQSLAYIFVDDDSEIEKLYEKYDALNNQVFFISWCQVLDLRKFVSFNGRLADLNSLYTLNMGTKMLKELLEKDSLHESDFQNYQTETEVITNIFKSRDSFDEISRVAFSEDFDPVLIKTNIDHQLMYLTYLRQAEIASLPIELSFSFNELECFSTMTIPVKKFGIEYLIDSLHDINTDNPFSHLLNIVLKTSSHLSITYIKNSSILKIRTFWNKNASNSHSLQINNISSIQALSFKKSRTLPQFNAFKFRIKSQDDIIKSVELKELPNSYIDFYKDSEQLKSVMADSNFDDLIRFAKDQITDPESTTVKGIEDVLEGFEKIGALKDVEEDIVRIISEKIKDEGFLENHSRLVEEVEAKNRVSSEAQEEIEDRFVTDFTRETIESMSATQLINAFGEEYGDEITKIKGFVDEISEKKSYEMNPYRDEIKDSIVHKLINSKLKETDGQIQHIMNEKGPFSEELSRALKIDSDFVEDIKSNFVSRTSNLESDFAMETLRSRTIINENSNHQEVEKLEKLEKQLDAYRKANNELHEKIKTYRDSQGDVQRLSSINSEKIEVESKTLDADELPVASLVVSENEKRQMLIELQKRDALLDRLKSSSRTLDSQRLDKIRMLEDQISKMSSAQGKQATNTLEARAKAAENKLDLSIKAVDIYKRKFEQISTKFNNARIEKEDQHLAVEIRSLNRVKNQLETQIKVKDDHIKCIDRKENEFKEINKLNELKISALEKDMKFKDSELKKMIRLESTKPKEVKNDKSKEYLEEIMNLKRQNQALQIKMAEISAKSAIKSKQEVRKTPITAANLKEKRLGKNLELAAKESKKAKEDLNSAKIILVNTKKEKIALEHKVTDLEREVKKYKRHLEEAKSENKKNAA